MDFQGISEPFWPKLIARGPVWLEKSALIRPGVGGYHASIVQAHLTRTGNKWKGAMTTM
jgi:hypothetical protein